MEPARNIELKARLTDLAAARAIAQRLATDYLGIQVQTDTYFHCPQGRLKLREIVDYGSHPNEPPRRIAQLIGYDRPDDVTAKQSDYQIVDIAPARAVALKRKMGIRVVVTKRREIFLHHNVRIHLDEVSGLGEFLEFEAVLKPSIGAAAGCRQVVQLQTEFGICEADLIATSYSDMLQAK